jgi:glutathione S-transferase
MPMVHLQAGATHQAVNWLLAAFWPAPPCSSTSKSGSISPLKAALHLQPARVCITASPAGVVAPGGCCVIALLFFFFPLLSFLMASASPQGPFVPPAEHVHVHGIGIGGGRLRDGGDGDGGGGGGGGGGVGAGESEGQGGGPFRVNLPLDLGIDVDGYHPSLEDASTYLRQQSQHHPHHQHQHPSHLQDRQQNAHLHAQGHHPHHQHDNHHHHHQLQQQHVPAVPAFGRIPGTQSHQHQHQPAGGQFGILAPANAQEVNFSTDAQGNGQPSGRIVVDPPDLEAWREKLFNVGEMMVLTDEQYQTYFPHIDNVYSHRSTQRYKRKPFVSHYWDCRMKGRPPGTPKSDDPNKKKRKRHARQRDLCDVKIKITEYAPGAQIQPDPMSGSTGGVAGSGDPSFIPLPLDVGPGQRFWTIQRVNGNGGNGKGDGIAGPHRHTLAKSDEIKKNSVQRYMAQQEKEVKKTQKQQPLRRATGGASATVKKRAKDSDLKLYAACFCPYSQRVWIALEAKGMAYQYCETDPYRRPSSSQLLEANPRGRVPAIRQGNWGCGESGIILEYLEDLENSVPLFPADPRLRANCRFWIDHVNSTIVPLFFSLLQLQNGDMDLKSAVDRLQSAITTLVLAADQQGPFFLGNTLSIVDIHFAPFAIRLSRMLQPLCGWPDPVPGTRWQSWLEALEGDTHIKATTSGPELYVETTPLLASKPAREPPG